MITKRAATGAALAAAAVLWLAAPAAADGLPRVVFCDDFTSVDPAQVSFCIEDAQGSVLGGGVSPTAEVLPAVVADPEAVGGWRLAIPEGWAGTAVMGAPPLVATPLVAAPEANRSTQDTGSPGSGVAWWLGAAALLAAATATAFGLRKRRASESASEMGGAEGI